jgi:FXSXX-COOH protein
MEFSATDVASDLRDLSEVPLAEVDAALDETPAEDTMRRVAPGDGTRLLVAASFNSAI